MSTSDQTKVTHDKRDTLMSGKLDNIVYQQHEEGNANWVGRTPNDAPKKLENESEPSGDKDVSKGMPYLDETNKDDKASNAE
jgi:hypothetical protein